MQHTLNLTANAICLPVVRNGKPVGELTLHPDDTVFLSKFYALLPKMESRRTALAAALTTKAEPAEALCAMETLWKNLRADIDEVFGAGTSALVFGSINSLALAQQFFEGVAAAMQNVRGAKLAQYTAESDALQ